MAGQGIIVVGSINIDLVVRGAKLPVPGETVVGGTFLRAAGGKGANQAVAAARSARGPVWFVGAVGEDAVGRELRKGLEQEGLRCEHLRTVPECATGTALILVDAAGQNLISVASGANARVTSEDVSAIPDDVWSQVAVCVVGLEIPWPAVRATLETARRRGVRTILNPAPVCPEAGAPDALALVDVLTPNRGELAALSGRRVETPDEVAAAARELQRRGVRTVIATLGDAGCLIVNDECRQIPARPVVAVDATAAGDCFTGVLAVGLAEGAPLVEAARRANAAAAISVTRPGAQPAMPRRTEIDAHFAESAQ